MEKRGKVNEAQLKADQAARERMISDFTAKATDAYSKILTRYPVMDRADDAKARLIALHQPVPRPTKAALALNKAEDAARRQQTMMSSVHGRGAEAPGCECSDQCGQPDAGGQRPC